MNNAKSFLPTPVIFAVGAVIGLALGLWIGWGLWPVEWQGGTLRDLDQADKAEYIAAVADAFVIYDTPEAAANARQRLSALEGDLNSEFVNAIRYFQTSNQPERTIRISNIGRLANSLGFVPPDLQNSAGASGETVGSNTQSTQADAQITEIAPTPNVATSPSTTSGNISWSRWLLWLLAAILLLTGGIYLMGAAGILDTQQITERLRNLTHRQSDVDEFESEEYDRALKQRKEAPPSTHVPPITHVSESEDLAFEHETDDDNWHTNPQNWQQSNWQPEETWQRDEWDSDYRSGPAVVPIDDHADLYAGAYDSDVEEEDEDEEWEDFEQEPQDAYDRFHPEPEESNPVHFTIDSIHDRGSTSSADATAQTEWDNADDGKVKTIDELMAERTSSFAAYQDQEDDDFADDEWEDEEYSAYDEDEDEEEDANNDEHPRPLPHTNDRTGHDGTRTSFRKEELDTVDPEAFQHRRPQLPPRPSPQAAVNENRQRERRPPQTQPAARRPRHQLIDQHTLSYQMGIAEYDESKPIVDPDVDKYIGEFGMGTAEKNGVVQPNGDYVAALEVWLFDKSDEKNMGNQTRILLSEYAVDHNLEQAFTKERTDNPRSFTPQPGVHFQLESQNLLLDCTIVDVKYLESGPGKGMFGSVRVDMSVHKKS